MWAQQLYWFHYIYTSPYSNMSIFSAGAFFAYFLAARNPPGVAIKALSVLCLTGTMLLLSYTIYAFGVAGKTADLWGLLYTAYQYTFPGVVCVFTLLYIYAFTPCGFGKTFFSFKVTLSEISHPPSA